MHKFSAFIILFFCLSTVQAQSGFYTSTSLGVSHSPSGNKSARYNTSYPSFSFNPGFIFDIRLWKVLKDKWQVGLAFETGSLQTPIKKEVEVYRNGVMINNYTSIVYREVVSGNVVPHAFVHYQFNFAKRSYVYAGLMAGMITGGNKVGLKSNITTAVGGADLGVAIAIRKNVKLQMNNGLRMFRINRGAELSASPDVSNTGGNAVITVRDFTSKYFVHTLGVVVGI